MRSVFTTLLIALALALSACGGGEDKAITQHAKECAEMDAATTLDVQCPEATPKTEKAKAEEPSLAVDKAHVTDVCVGFVMSMNESRGDLGSDDPAIDAHIRAAIIEAGRGEYENCIEVYEMTPRDQWDQTDRNFGHDRRVAEAEAKQQ